MEGIDFIILTGSGVNLLAKFGDQNSDTWGGHNRIEKYGFVEGVDYVSLDKIIKREIGATTASITPSFSTWPKSWSERI